MDAAFKIWIANDKASVCGIWTNIETLPRVVPRLEDLFILGPGKIWFPLNANLYFPTPPQGVVLNYISHSGVSRRSGLLIKVKLHCSTILSVSTMLLIYCSCAGRCFFYNCIASLFQCYPRAMFQCVWFASGHAIPVRCGHLKSHAAKSAWRLMRTCLSHLQVFLPCEMIK